MPRRIENETDLFDDLSFEQKLQLYATATELFSENKRQLFDRLAQNRTRHVTVVLEDIFQSHNASAVLRSCDCFGVQDVHVVENRNEYHVSGEVAMGSEKWVDYHMHRNILDTYALLRKRGYRIVATTPHENDSLLPDLDIQQPTALVFGTELTGLSDKAIEHADAYVKIPMYGFTESFNISVCCALSLYSVTEKMRRTPNLNWQMTPEEQATLKLYWCMQAIRDGEKTVKMLKKRLFKK